MMVVVNLDEPEPLAWVQFSQHWMAKGRPAGFHLAEPGCELLEPPLDHLETRSDLAQGESPR